LKETNRLINAAGFAVHNTDITIVAQKPKLLPFIPQMVHSVAEALVINESAVNVKATTTEKLGFEGREEGISAYAVCLLK
jgi:2-C-methyl-D-erythritol 2,4-cyclodiphosphate synthase